MSHSANRISAKRRAPQARTPGRGHDRAGALAARRRVALKFSGLQLYPYA